MLAWQHSRARPLSVGHAEEVEGVRVWVGGKAAQSASPAGLPTDSCRCNLSLFLINDARIRKKHYKGSLSSRTILLKTSVPRRYTDTTNTASHLRHDRRVFWGSRTQGPQAGHGCYDYYVWIYIMYVQWKIIMYYNSNNRLVRGGGKTARCSVLAGRLRAWLRSFKYHCRHDSPI